MVVRFQRAFLCEGVQDARSIAEEVPLSEVTLQGHDLVQVLLLRLASESGVKDKIHQREPTELVAQEDEFSGILVIL